MLKNRVRIWLFLLLCLGWALSVSAETLQELSTELNGEWHGELRPVESDEVGWPENAAGEPLDSLPVQLVITDEHVDVLTLHEYEWRSVCLERFQINRLGPSAVLSCLASREGWAESWAYSVTRTDGDRLRVFWYKVVNKFERPRDSFASAGVGTLNRAAKFDGGAASQDRGGPEPEPPAVNRMGRGALPAGAGRHGAEGGPGSGGA